MWLFGKIWLEFKLVILATKSCKWGCAIAEKCSNKMKIAASEENTVQKGPPSKKQICAFKKNVFSPMNLTHL